MKPGSLSVRARLTLWHATALLLIICAFSAGIFVVVRAWMYRDLDQQIGRDLATAERVYREDPGDLIELESRVGLTLFEIAENGKVLQRGRDWQRSGLPAVLPERSPPGPWTVSSPDGHPYRLAGISDPSHRIVLALDEAPLRRTLSTLAVILAIGVPIAVGLAIAGGYLLAGRVLAPVGEMAERARRISASSLGERLPVANPSDEFGRLAAVLNDALARVHASFEQLRRFTADASHELRTPLTAMRSVGEVALQKSLDAAAYRDVIGSMLEEVDRLTRLVESLLTLTRAESGALRLNRETVNLSAIASNVADQLRVLADEKEQNLRVESREDLSAECDPAILRLALTNLLHNAIKYTPNRGTIRVGVRRISPSECALEVSDTGPGIPAQDRDRIFDRFYRLDAGRSRDAGGVGLGLAIARWAVEANGGRIELESDAERGSLFRIVLPIDPGDTRGFRDT